MSNTFTPSRRTIRIRTVLDYRIAGPRRSVDLERPASPRNLAYASKFLGELRRENIQGYGNIGCGVSWIELDDHDITGLVEYGVSTAQAAQILHEVDAELSKRDASFASIRVVLPPDSCNHDMRFAGVPAGWLATEWDEATHGRLTVAFPGVEVAVVRRPVERARLDFVRKGAAPSSVWLDDCDDSDAGVDIARIRQLVDVQANALS